MKYNQSCTFSNGIDEVQTVTTSCDDVIPEVQTITTNAVDNDEIQEIKLTSDDIDEIQLVRAHNEDIPAVQRVRVDVPRVFEVQQFGILISNINTNGDEISSLACYGIQVGEACKKIENAITGIFTVSFDFDECGGGDASFCQEIISKYNPNLGVISCTPGLVTNPAIGGDHFVFPLK